jgi:hypothetical protein
MSHIRYLPSFENSRKLSLKPQKASNYKIASFLQYVNNWLFKVLWENWTELNYKEVDEILEQAKDEFLRRIFWIITPILEERKKLWLWELNTDFLTEIFRENIFFILWLYFWNYRDDIDDGSFNKTTFYHHTLWQINFREERLWRRKIPQSLKEAYFNTFLEQIFSNLLLPEKWKVDRLLEIQRFLWKKSISKEEIMEYEKMIRTFLRKYKIHWYEKEDLIQEWFEAIFEAKNKYEWRWFALPKAYIKIVLRNHFRNLRREQFALKRWWWEIQPINMWFYEDAIIDEYSAKEWELMKAREIKEWVDLKSYRSPISLFPIMSNNLKRRKNKD